MLTVLAAIGAWAGLHAWRNPTALGTAIDTALTARPAMPQPKLGPLPRVRHSVDASFAGRDARRSAKVEIVVRDGVSDDTLHVSILDPATFAPLASRRLTAEAAEPVFEGLPDSELLIVLHTSERSPRFGWLSRTVLPSAAGSAIRRATLSAARHDVTIRLRASSVQDDGRWVPLLVSLTRVEDPEWGAGASTPIETAFAPGNADVDVRFAALGAGRYRIRFSGFTADPGEALEFAVPGSGLVEIRGVPR